MSRLHTARVSLPSGVMASLALMAGLAVAGEAPAAGRHFATISTVASSGVGTVRGGTVPALEPFFTTKVPGQGSGLGLSMADGFVKQSGGQLAITSKPGEGSTIQLYLPRTGRPEKAVAEDSRGQPRAAAAAHILLVEDDPMVRDQVARQLRTLGYRVTPVADGRAAVEVVAQDFSVALLMTDIVMPGGMNGRQVADHARLLRADMAVLFTSGYTDDDIFREGRLNPGDAFLAKPYRRAKLAEAVARALSAGRGSSSG